jgi:hypothetical protein
MVDFRLAPNGTIVRLDSKNNAILETASITFKNIEVEINPNTYEGRYRFTGGENVQFFKVLHLVPEATHRLTTITNQELAQIELDTLGPVFFVNDKVFVFDQKINFNPSKVQITPPTGNTENWLIQGIRGYAGDSSRQMYLFNNTNYRIRVNNIWTDFNMADCTALVLVTTSVGVFTFTCQPSQSIANFSKFNFNPIDEVLAYSTKNQNLSTDINDFTVSNDTQNVNLQNASFESGLLFVPNVLSEGRNVILVSGVNDLGAPITSSDVYWAGSASLQVITGAEADVTLNVSLTENNTPYDFSVTKKTKDKVVRFYNLPQVEVTITSTQSSLKTTAQKVKLEPGLNVLDLRSNQGVK